METDTTAAGEGANLLRAAMRAWTSGVAVVTAVHDGERHGMTVSSFTSVSLDPPMIIISLQTASRTHDMVAKARAFGVTILAVGQRQLAERFADQQVSMEERLEGLDLETLETGAPFIKGGLAFLDCRVRESIAVGMNTLFLAEVVAVRGDDHDEPLVYHDRGYRGLSG